MSPRIRLTTLIAMLVVVLTAGVLTAGSAFADRDGPVVTPRGDPDAAIFGGVRFRSFNSSVARLEVFQGSDLNPPSDPGTLVTQNLTWKRSNRITFTYDATAHTLTSKVNNEPELVFPNFAPDGALNYLRIVVVERDTGQEVDFSHVKLDTFGLGDFTTVTPNLHEACFTLNPDDPANSWCSWRVTGYDLTNGFTIRGKIDLNGTFPSLDPETSKVEVVVGYLAEGG